MYKDFILANWLIIVVVIIFILVLALLYRAGHRERVKQIILSLVVQAEKALGSGTGELKYALVVERLYYVMPLLIRFLYTKKEIDQYITEAVEWLKEYLVKGHTLIGYENELINDYVCIATDEMIYDFDVVKRE